MLGGARCGRILHLSTAGCEEEDHAQHARRDLGERERPGEAVESEPHIAEDDCGEEKQGNAQGHERGGQAFTGGLEPRDEHDAHGIKHGGEHERDQHFLAGSDQRGVAHELKQLVTEYQNGDGEDNGGCHRYHCGGFQRRTHAVSIAGTVSVGEERNTAHADTHTQHFGYHVQAHRQPKGGHGVVTVSCRNIVEHQHGNGQICTLNQFGGTHGEHGFNNVTSDHEIAGFPREVGALANKELQVVHHGCGVCGEHRPTGTGDTPAENRNQQNIEN